MKRSLIVILVIVLLAVFGRVSAQDVPLPIVCQDVDYGVGSFIFHIPAEWNNPDIASWWFLGDGLSQLTDGSITDFRGDWLTNYTDVLGEGFPEWQQNIKNHQIYVGSGDYSVIVIGDESTPACNANGYPVQPPASTPTPEPTDQACTVDGNGKTYCYSTAGLQKNLSGYVVPVPPPPQ